MVTLNLYMKYKYVYNCIIIIIKNNKIIRLLMFLNNYKLHMTINTSDIK